MKKLPFLALAMVMAAGCASATNDEEANEESAPSVDATAAQRSAFKSLSLETQQKWTWIQNDVLKTPLHLSATRTGRSIVNPGGDVGYATLSLLEAHKDLFKMHSPATELAKKRIDADEMGMRHVRFQQVVKGVPVYGAELAAHYDDAGRVTAIDANYISGLDDVDVVPRLVSSDALALAKAEIATVSAMDPSALESDEGQLVVLASEKARLVYQHKIQALSAKDPAIWITFVDAKTGEVVHRYNNLQTIEGSGAGVRGDAKKIEVTASGNGFVMTDTSGGVAIRTFTARQVQTTPGTAVTSNSSTQWDTGVAGAGAAVDAHFNAAAVFKYYKDKHARNAIDGAGGQMISTAHFGQSYENAAWDGTGMLYGDGGTIFFPLSVSLDVVGHEFTHGVTEKTSGLLYENQSGALNEAVSDIFGAFIEHSISPDDVKNWAMGETVVRNGSPLRDMRNPSGVDDPQPAHMTKFVNTQQDNGGVHINSGIINNAAFLMTMGGTNPVSKVEVKYGIGWDKSEKLWYRANTKYFMQSTNFGQAAAGVLQAAKDVGLDQNETNIVECAFKAVGVVQGTCATLTNPQSTTPGTPGADPTTPGTDPTTDPTTGDSTSDSDTTTTKPTTRKRRIVTQESSGCSAGGKGSPTELLPIALGLGLMLVRRRRAR